MRAAYEFRRTNLGPLLLFILAVRVVWLGVPQDGSAFTKCVAVAVLRCSSHLLRHRRNRLQRVSVQPVVDVDERLFALLPGPLDE